MALDRFSDGPVYSTMVHTATAPLQKPFKRQQEQAGTDMGWKDTMLNKKNFGITAATYGLLALAGTVSFSLPNSLPTINASSAMGAANEQIRIHGVVRDFSKSNTDFKTAPSGGNGHYAGNIGLSLGADDRPAFTGTGYKVSAQWRDKDSRQIAPHLFSNAYTLRLASAPTRDQNTVIDTWDSSVGAYGGSNIGPAPSVVTGATMPTLNAPTGMGASVGSVYYTNGPPSFGTPITLSSNIRCQNFTTRRDTTINISGHLTFYCEGNFVLAQRNVLNILPNSSLTLYVTGLFMVSQTSTMNMNTWKPSLLKIYNLGTTRMEINQASKVCAQIVTPQAGLRLAQDDHFYGTFVGQTIRMDQTTGFHLDKSIPKDACNVTIADTAGTKGSNSTGGIPSAARFAEWFNDVPTVNSSVSSPIVLTKNSSGVYEYLTDAYHPIDNQALGNETEAHNNYFTLAVTVQFTHRACQGGFFEFQGCDDAWLFVDRSLGMDLGGMVPNTVQYVAIDRFNLVDGKVYSLHFFYAQRQANMATFKMRTNLELIGEAVAVPVSAMYD